ncbi:MAG: aminopeptidase [Casimicrobiaceae bacterium]
MDYYWQSARGQYEILDRAQPLDVAIATTGDGRLKQRLELAQRIREFASRSLGLPDNGSYRRYSDLKRAFVIWNVFAAPRLSLAPHAWCYPVAGCVNYRGYFSEQEARSEAAALAAAGDDVYIGGVPAYSTLGWFEDPILSTFVRYPQTEFARLIFHELAHQALYVKGDTVFNESYATALSDAGLDRWIAAQPPAQQALLQAERARNERLRGAFERLVADARVQLAALYASDTSAAAKQQRKDAIFASMRAQYQDIKRGEPGLAGFDRWFDGYDHAGPNNASIASIALYTQRVPAFRALIADVKGDLPAFYVRLRALAALDKPAREAALDALAAPSDVVHRAAMRCVGVHCNRDDTY